MKVRDFLDWYNEQGPGWDYDVTVLVHGHEHLVTRAGFGGHGGKDEGTYTDEDRVILCVGKCRHFPHTTRRDGER